jgi:hypothetical protein
MTTLTTEERFWRQVSKTDSCWNWTGYVYPGRGGRFYLAWKPKVAIVDAQRYSYELHFGPITPNDYIDQTCSNVACVNPAHLQLRKRNPGEQARFDEKVYKFDNGCWIWTAAHDSHGYGLFRLDGHGKQVRATHYSWELHTGRPVPPGIFICHTCDHPACVNPEHLFLGTHSDNMKDMSEKGRAAQGETHVRAKLTKANVTFIRESKLTNVELGKMFGVSHATVARARKCESWKRLP